MGGHPAGGAQTLYISCHYETSFHHCKILRTHIQKCARNAPAVLRCYLNKRKEALKVCLYDKLAAVESSSDINIHIKQNQSDDQPYSCSLLYLLNNHIKSQHYNDGLYSCSLCCYRSEKSLNLNRHMKHRHSNDRPHSCSLCSYNAVKLSYLNSHMKFKQPAILMQFVQL